MAKKQTMDHAQLLVLSLLAGEDMYGYQMIAGGGVPAGGPHRPGTEILPPHPPGDGGSEGGGPGLADLLRRGERRAPGLPGAGAGMTWTGGSIQTGS